MKITWIIFTGLVFMLCNTVPASAETNLAEALAEARKGEDGSQYYIFDLEDAIKEGRASYVTLKSSEVEFAKLMQKGCLSTTSRLNKEIRSEMIALNKIFELENTLLECRMTYEEVNISKTEIGEIEKISYKILAEEAFSEYKATKNPVNLVKYRRFLIWGNLTPKDLNFSEADLSILASLK